MPPRTSKCPGARATLIGPDRSKRPCCDTRALNSAASSPRTADRGAGVVLATGTVARRSSSRILDNWRTTLIRSSSEIEVHAEAPHGARGEHFAGPEHGRRELRMVRRVREVLRLEREPHPCPVGASSLAAGGAVESLAGVEVDPRLGRGDREAAAAHGVIEFARSLFNRASRPRCCAWSAISPGAGGHVDKPDIVVLAREEK